MTDCITLPMRAVVDGRTWHLYAYEYQTPDGTFGGYLYAVSFEHAAALLADLKETAVLQGKMVGAET